MNTNDLDALAERLVLLSRRWIGGSTTGGVAAQVEYLERMLPATFRDVAPGYADAVEQQPGAQLARARLMLARTEAVLEQARREHEAAAARVAELDVLKPDALVVYRCGENERDADGYRIVLESYEPEEWRMNGTNFDGHVFRVRDNVSGEGTAYHACVLADPYDEEHPGLERVTTRIDAKRLTAAPEGLTIGDVVPQVVARPIPESSLSMAIGDLAVVRSPKHMWDGVVVRVMSYSDDIAALIDVQGKTVGGQVMFCLPRAQLKLAPAGMAQGEVVS